MEEYWWSRKASRRRSCGSHGLEEEEFPGSRRGRSPQRGNRQPGPGHSDSSAREEGTALGWKDPSGPLRRSAGARAGGGGARAPCGRSLGRTPNRSGSAGADWPARAGRRRQVIRAAGSRGHVGGARAGGAGGRTAETRRARRGCCAELRRRDSRRGGRGECARGSGAGAGGSPGAGLGTPGAEVGGGLGWGGASRTLPSITATATVAVHHLRGHLPCPSASVLPHSPLGRCGEFLCPGPGTVSPKPWPRSTGASILAGQMTHAGERPTES